MKKINLGMDSMEETLDCEIGSEALEIFRGWVHSAAIK
jgi:hypothetical protein